MGQWGLFFVAGYGQRASGCKQAEKQALRAAERSNDIQLIYS